MTEKRDINESTGQTEYSHLESTLISASDVKTEVVWDEHLRKVTIFIGRVGLAFLFFSQLFWKLPPHFGCPDGQYVFSAVGPEGNVQRSTGLCDWIGIESVWSQRDRSFFVIDFNNDSTPDFEIHLDWLVLLNGWFVDHVVIPHFQIFGWLIFLTEVFIVLSLFFGVLTRMGALLSLLLSLQLMLGLAGVSDLSIGLSEWEWSYHLMILLSLMVLGTAPGRVFGIDVLLRSRLLISLPSRGIV